MTDFWSSAGSGYERSARPLARLLAGGPVILLPDCVLPGAAGSVALLAVGPTGVTAIAAESVTGPLRVRVTGGRLLPRTEQLLVQGRDRTRIVEALVAQTAAVRSVLERCGAPEVPVSGLLCLSDAGGLPLIASLEVRGVQIRGTRGAARHLVRPGLLEDERIAAVARVLDATLR